MRIGYGQRFLVIVIQLVDLRIGPGDLQIGAVVIGGIDQGGKGVLAGVQFVQGDGVDDGVDEEIRFGLQDQAELAFRIVDRVDQVAVFSLEAIELCADADHFFLGDITFAFLLGESVCDLAERFDLGIIDFGGLPLIIDLEEIGTKGVFERAQEVEELVLGKLYIGLGELDCLVAFAGDDDLLVQLQGGFVIVAGREELVELSGIKAVLMLKFGLG